MRNFATSPPTSCNCTKYIVILWPLIFMLTIPYSDASGIVIKVPTAEERWSTSVLTAKILDQCTDSFKIAGITIIGNTSLELFQCIKDLKNSSFYTITRDDSYRVKDICAPIEWTVNVSCTIKPMKTSLNLIMANDVNYLETTLTYAKHMLNRHWRVSSYHIIILSMTSCDRATARRTLKLVWKFKILNAILTCCVNPKKSSNGENLKIYTFNPYSMDHVHPWHLVSKEIIKVSLHSYSFNHSWYLYERKFRFDDWTIKELLPNEVKPNDEEKYNKNYDLCKTVFFEKTRNLKNYVIPVSIIPFPPSVMLRANKTGLKKWIGEDGMILRTIAEKLHFRIYELPIEGDNPLGAQLENGSFTGSIKDVVYGHSNIILPSRYVEMLSEMDYTYPHVKSGTCLLTLAPGYYPVWMNIILDWDCWILTILAVVYLCLILLYVKIKKDRDIVWTVLNTCKIFLGISTKDLTINVKHRCIIGSVILVLLITNGIFTGRLVSLLTIPRAYKTIDTLQQVKDSGMPIYGFEKFKKLLTDPVLKSRYGYSKYSECLSGIIKNNDYKACMMDCLLAELWETKTPKLYMVKETVRTWHLSNVVTTNWLLLERYDLENFRMIESGLRFKWRRDVMRAVQVSTWSWRRTMDLESFNPLQLKALLLPFIILCSGLTLATVVFILEIILKRYLLFRSGQ